MSRTDTILTALALALWLGQVANANAHELIHRPRRVLRRLGVVGFVTLLYGHHASAHPKVHHRFVGTPRDPATARLGESFHRYMVRAWRGGFRKGHAAEQALLRARHGAEWRRHDPYLWYVGGGLACMALAWGLGGLAGMAWYLVLAGAAQTQILMSDYVQHYGLRRAETAPGTYEPVGPAHSWNAPHVYSGAMMLNAPRHSDHHTHPARPFATLRLDRNMPLLPYSLPVMASIALYPRLWRRVMDHRARAWSADRHADAA